MATRSEVRQVLTHVLDGAVAANVVDLGLLYNIDIIGDTVHVQLGATAPDAMTDAEVTAEARRLILQRTNALHVRVDMVHNRHWTPAMMNDEARKSLNIRADEG